ncbi:MAG: Glycosyl transferase group 1 [Candidatus Roizmanbacteria bacterium GW2011_GWC2_37_13]|uniref:Glycosyl transferase group 1 n=1 Tax=Candidatus Roizmanbacteria bacterium GW2011_GWC2_37_13 TaxID=1618486 RepID=A0A0G0GIR8_9BACT|nr:MAG: glycosyl transferase group 1 [Candidatus Roizmanbacteria bacterium GW2011_GWC1_37_12]KKQ26005.1 MAG: Glycosyl transferase group 1 [Candidatus Roizmanbacteria bacterium GW2011_GWC2_37_13]
MKVLYLYMFPLWGNGSGNWLRRLVYRLDEHYGQDFEAMIVAPERRKVPGAKIRTLKPPMMGVFVGNPELPNERRYSKMSNLDHVKIFNYYLLQTAKVIEKFKPNLIHVFHTAFLPPVARSLANLYKIPFIITTHGSDLYYFKEDNRWKANVRDASVRAKYITANSNFTREWYLDMFGHDLYKKMKTIPSGIGYKTDFNKDVSWIDKKYNFKYDKMVLFTGRLTQHKGVEYLIKAARQIKAEVVIAGDGPEKKYLESLIVKYKLVNVHMVGYFSSRLETINDFYLRADVYVAPSVWNEPLGLVILEAMSHNTPVVVSRKGGVTTIVKDGINGFLIRPRSPALIVEKVNLLLNDDKLRWKMGNKAYKTVMEKFNWTKIAAKFYHLYEKSLQKPRPNGKNHVK